MFENACVNYKKGYYLLNLKLFVGVVKFKTREEFERIVHLHLKPGLKQVGKEASFC